MSVFGDMSKAERNPHPAEAATGQPLHTLEPDPATAPAQAPDVRPGRFQPATQARIAGRLINRPAFGDRTFLYGRMMRGDSVDAVVAISLIRMAAADLAMEPWQRPSDAYLVQLSLDALMADIEAPSPPLLAGLARGEYPQARELFDLVLEELGLLPPASEDLAKARWTAARWWAGQIVARQLDPVHGAKLIYQESAAELDYPDALQPIVDLARALDLLNDQPPHQQHIRDQVTSAARDFLATEAHQNQSL